MSKKIRLDVLVTERGLCESRQKAQATIMAGLVFVDGQRSDKPGTPVAEDASVEVRGHALRYVSRGGLKLEKAMQTFPITLEGKVCADIGASTGGFCDVLLRRGAAHVIALDVGHGQLDPRIAGNERIIEMSGVNIRDVEADDLPYRPSMIVSDVSFISLTYVIPVIARIAAPGAHVVLLVKPQFEVGKGNLGKNGIVESETLRKQALDTVTACAKANGLDVRATAVSPIEGTHGNIEYLLYAVA